MMNSRPRPRPLDGILYFNEPSNPTSDDQKELIINKVVQFNSLPIVGWNDQNDALQCKNHCVRDCSCVYHCSWIVA